MPSFFVRLLCLVSSPRFLAWLFRPAFKDNKVISSFSTFLRLLQSFLDIPRIPPLFSAPLFSLFILFSEPLGALRIASFLSSFSSLVSYSPFFLSCSLFFLSHLTFPASFRYSLHLFSFFLFRASWCSLYSFAGLCVSFLFSFPSPSHLHLISFSSHLISSLVLFSFSSHLLFLIHLFFLVLFFS